MSDSDKVHTADEKKPEETKPWPSWIPRFKDIIQAIGVLIALVALFFVYCDLSNTVKQTKAVMASQRPILTIQPVVKLTDLTPFIGRIKGADGKIHETTDSSQYRWRFRVNNENIGTACLSTMRFDIAWDMKWWWDTASYNGVELVKDRPLVVECPYKLEKGGNYAIRVRLDYDWTEKSLATGSYRLERFYEFDYDERLKDWSIQLTGETHWDSVTTSLTARRPPQN